MSEETKMKRPAVGTTLPGNPIEETFLTTKDAKPRKLFKSSSGYG